MNEQIILLLFVIPSSGITILLPFWKSKKEIDYKKDERLQLIQNKANNTANYLNYILLILFIFIGQTISINSDINITFTLNRLCTYGVCFIVLRNAIELFALKYFENKI
ncbi:MAG: hypothetical protein ACLUG9_05050 [Paraclostridium sordellii]|uniref:hypothetical protein n=1 Tax=Paraclostridium sordellii TaxID=1505 RepID=UPI0005E621CA|nr:hypothetical protein [Paeniclostridium sordellii]CEQ10425.1 Uncharacterised protein [[Clostridium] sordellii] [Paeniclostridium sordellii]